MNIDAIRGHSFPPRELRPEERLSVANYARAVGSQNPAYLSTDAARAAGYDSRPLPRAMLTFFNTLDETDLTEVMGIVYGRTLFAGTDSEWGVVATEQDTLVGQTHVDEAYERTGKDGAPRQFLVLRTEFHTKEGELVSRQRITFIEKVV